MKLSTPIVTFLLFVMPSASLAKRIGETQAQRRDLQGGSSAGFQTPFGSASGSLICFSSHTTADVQGRGPVPMNEIKVGDEILTAKGNYEPVYAMAHRHPSKSANFIQIHAEGNDKPLELSEKHMVFLGGNPNPVPAASVRVGDQVKTLDGFRDVAKIDTVTREGVFNPLTPDGTVVVNGIVASIYSALLSDNDWIEIAGMKILSHQNFFHMALKPYRMMCTGISLDLCKTNNEKVAIVQLAADVTNYASHYDTIYQEMALGFVIIMVCLFDVMLSPFAVLAGSIMIGYYFMFANKDKKKIML